MHPSRSSALLVLAACSGPQRAEPPACTAETALVLGGQDDVAAAARCTVVASLTIRTGAPLDLAPLAALREVRGAIVVGPSVGFEELRLAGLVAAGSLAVSANGNLLAVQLPELASSGAIEIASNSALTTIAMPRLAVARGDIAVVGNSEVGLVELSGLAAIEGTLRVIDNPQLTLLELGKLDRVRAVEVANNESLDDDIASALRAKAAP